MELTDAEVELKCKSIHEEIEARGKIIPEELAKKRSWELIRNIEKRENNIYTFPENKPDFNKPSSEVNLETIISVLKEQEKWIGPTALGLKCGYSERWAFENLKKLVKQKKVERNQYGQYKLSGMDVAEQKKGRARLQITQAEIETIRKLKKQGKSGVEIMEITGRSASSISKIH